MTDQTPDSAPGQPDQRPGQGLREARRRYGDRARTPNATTDNSAPDTGTSPGRNEAARRFGDRAVTPNTGRTQR